MTDDTMDEMTRRLLEALKSGAEEPTLANMPVDPDMTMEDLWTAFIEGVDQWVRGPREKALMRAAFFSGAISDNKLMKALTMLIKNGGKEGLLEARKHLNLVHEQFAEVLNDLHELLTTEDGG